MIRHLRSLLDLSASEAESIIARAIELKAMTLSEQPTPLKRRSVALIFEKPSTRTRVSFATGVSDFGGSCIFLSPEESQLGRGESTSDTANVLSRLVDLIIIRTSYQTTIEELAENASVPVINALSDLYHPCQVLADIQSYVEHRGCAKGIKAAWIGDGNNVCHSWINAARLFDFEISIATPKGFEPDQSICQQNQNRVTLSNDPVETARNADVIITDTWASMGQESEKREREQIFKDFTVTSELMNLASNDALFMHCLPAYRGYEVDADVIDGPQSVIWDEVENRLHAQKALMEFLLSETGNV